MDYADCMDGIERIIHLYPDTVDKAIAEVRLHGDMAYVVGLLALSWLPKDLKEYQGDDLNTKKASLRLQFAQAEGEENRWEYAKHVFLAHLGKHAQIPLAVQSQPWFSRRDFEKEFASNPAFAEAWEEAISLAKGRLLGEAFRRAVDGVEEPTVYKGQFCYSVDSQTGKQVQNTIRKFSDPLLQTLLKGYHEKFKDEITIKSNQQATLAALTSEQIDVLWGALREKKE